MSDDQTPASCAPHAPGGAPSPGSKGEVGGEAPRAAQGRTELRDAIAEALALQINGPASDGRGWYRVGGQREELIAQADAVFEVVGPAIERVHQMTDACDELLVRERAAHAKTAAKLSEYENALGWGTSCTSCARVLDGATAERERAERAEAAVQRVRDAHSEVDSPTGPICVRCRFAYPCGVVQTLDTPGPAVEDETAGGAT